jgi:hypothetical protein
MNFNDISDIKKNGFTGFKKMRDLFYDSSSIPKTKGVYIVLNVDRKAEFLPVGTGGYFKGKDYCCVHWQGRKGR